MIERDPAFHAQWAVQVAVARLRLQGIEPTPQQIAAMARQQEGYLGLPTERR